MVDHSDGPVFTVFYELKSFIFMFFHCCPCLSELANAHAHKDADKEHSYLTFPIPVSFSALLIRLVSVNKVCQTEKTVQLQEGTGGKKTWIMTVSADATEASGASRYWPDSACRGTEHPLKITAVWFRGKLAPVRSELVSRLVTS